MLFYTHFRIIVVMLTIVNVTLCRYKLTLFVHPFSCIFIHPWVLLGKAHWVVLRILERFYPKGSFDRHMQPASCECRACIWIQSVISPDSFIPEKWGPCSVTCGQGFRKREVQCKIFLEFSKTIARLPDVQCQGPKPSEVERCVLEPCSSQRYLDCPLSCFV
jgi:hypothetical protein